MRRILALVLAVGALSAPMSWTRTAAAPRAVGVLRAGSDVFWEGGRVAGAIDRVSGGAPAPGADCPAGPCFSYRLDLSQPGGRLRVAIDVPQRNDSFLLTLADPSGSVVARAINANAFDAEAFTGRPAAGTWTIAVTPLTAQYSTFALRAKLESKPYEPPAGATMWLPNLQVPRLWEFGFVAPVTGLAGVSFDDANPPVDALGVHPFSCTADETQAGAQRCLRFSFELVNAGDGYFDVRFDTSKNPLEGKMVQCIQRRGKKPLAHPAGEFDFHAAHAHYHYKDVVRHLLYRVTDRSTGAMVLAGRGEKTGYHPADQSFADWSRFVQAKPYTSGTDGNCYPGSDEQIGLSRGWGDAYRWQRPGNYVEFGDNPDGYYVVQTVVDPKNHVMESDESDNVGFAYVRVVGDSVQMLEEGRGLSPWDPNKVDFRY